LQRDHADIARHAVALPEVAGRAGGNDVFPGGAPAFRPRDDVIEGQIVAGAAILALETVAEENVEPGEGGVAGRLDIFTQRNDGRQLHGEARTSHHGVVFGDDVHAIHEHRLDRILPGPE